MRYPLYVCGSVSLEELGKALAAAGLVVRSDTQGRMVADPIPNFIRREDPVVVPMRRKAR